MTEPITLSRREFFKSSAWTAALFGLPAWAAGLDEHPPAAFMGFNTVGYQFEWEAPAGLAGTDPAVVVLNRIAFGPRPGDVERVRAIGVDAYIEEQLRPERIDDSNMDALLKPFTSLSMTAAQLAQAYGDALEQQRLKRLESAQGSITDPATAVEGFIALFGNQAQARTPQQTMQLLTEVIQATVLRQILSSRQLIEVMVDFWSNHLNIYIGKNQDRFLKTVDDREVVRKYALGKFPDLLFASAHSPAMLVFLDNISNVKGVPNENYARELMELHTLSVNGGYTQQDVQEVARCFTGWSVSTPARSLLGADYDGAGEFLFRAKQHDTGPKLVLGHAIAAGGGVSDGEQVLELLARHPSTAEFISTKLVRRLVADNPPPGLVQRAADSFTKTDGDIRAVLGTILHSDEFKQSFGQKLKRPLEYVASAVRALDGRVSPQSLGRLPLKGNQAGGNAPNQAKQPVIAQALRVMGQVPFNWQAPNGYPDSAGAWINSNNLLARWNLALALAGGKAGGVEIDIERAQAGASSASPEAAVDFWTERLLHRAIPAADRQKLIGYLGGSLAPDGISNLVALLLASPHFQLR